jgi:hypothetical protein
VPIVVTLTDAEVAEAHRLGDEAYHAFKASHRYHNNLGPSLRKRKLGEIAVERWARTLGVEVEAPFRDIALASREDLVIGGVRVEVKTWHHDAWGAMGRSVTPGNVETIRHKADAIVWCSLEGDTVTVHGWSTLDDVEAVPLTMTGPAHHPVATHQVPLEDLRPLERLIEEAAA